MIANLSSTCMGKEKMTCFSRKKIFSLWTMQNLFVHLSLDEGKNPWNWWPICSLLLSLVKTCSAVMWCLVSYIEYLSSASFFFSFFFVFCWHIYVTFVDAKKFILLICTSPYNRKALLKRSFSVDISPLLFY